MIANFLLNEAGGFKKYFFMMEKNKIIMHTKGKEAQRETLKIQE